MHFDGLTLPALLAADDEVEPRVAPRIAPGRRTRSERLPVQRRAIEGNPTAATPGSVAWASARVLDPFGLHLPGATGAGHDADAAATAATAARGVAGAGGALPFLDTIQRSFGRHALDGVRAHSDTDAALAAGAIGARAYATGDAIAFAGAPDLHTAAHEAAHVIQQRAGVQLAGGVGAAGDAYEAHADAVADRVVRGQSAEELLDRSPDRSPDRGPDCARSGPAVQRAIEHEVVPPQPEPGIHDYVVAFDKAVQQAYFYVLHVPTLGAYRELDGYTEQWAESWDLHTRGTPHPMMAAHFGYAVESLTTLVYLPPAPPGMAIELQGPRGATRPDVILKRGSTDLAWLDITSAGSADHIWDKAGWDKQTFHLAELSYPKMDTAHFNPTPGYKDDVDQQAFFRRKQFAAYIKTVREQAWRTLGLAFKAPRGGEPLMRQNTLPGRIMDRLSQHFGVAVDRPTAASVLTMMGVNPMTHCLYDSVSRARGAAFLLQHDPNLPTIEIPEQDAVPRLLLPHGYEERLQMLVQMEQHGQLEPEDLDAEPSDQQQLVVPDEGQDHLEPVDEQALTMPGQVFELNLPSLHVPPAMLEQLNQFLLQQQLAFAFEISNGDVTSQVFVRPGPRFAASVGQALREARRQARRYLPRQERGPALRAAWKLKLGFSPARRSLGRPGGVGALTGPAPTGAPFVFSPPPFLLQLPSLMAPDQTDQTDEDAEESGAVEMHQ